jgi:hypothetical protein
VTPRKASLDARSPGQASRLALFALGGLAFAGCAADGASPANDGGAGAPSTLELPYAAHVVAFEPGEGAGFGQSGLPDIVLGPPDGKGYESGSLDVLSLGRGGSIVLGFEGLAITDGDGPDLVVFENPFWPGGDASAVYAEPGEVSVSEDGETWLTFACDREGDGEGNFDGCAGVTPTLEYDASVGALDPLVTGGDAFDLADLGVKIAHFVRVRDVSLHGDAPSAGFDLDAVGIANAVPVISEP